METSILQSTKPLSPEDIIHTNGSLPVIVLCENLDFYVVKYGRPSFSELVKEYLCASFLRYWGLGVPDYSFVRVLPKHVPMGLHAQIQPFFFQELCFGSKYGRNFEEATRLSQGMSDYQKKLIVKKAEFLEISLFDLWTSNEDRNENNYNLMLDVSSGYRFTPIDHQHTFNSGRAGQALNLLTESESLIGTTFFGQLFTRKDVRSHLSGVGAKNKFYLCVKRCFDDLEGVVSEIPDGWHSNKKQLLENLRQTIFQENWKQLVWNTFMEYLHVATN